MHSKLSRLYTHWYHLRHITKVVQRHISKFRSQLCLKTTVHACFLFLTVYTNCRTHTLISITHFGFQNQYPARRWLKLCVNHERTGRRGVVERATNKMTLLSVFKTAMFQKVYPPASAVISYSTSLHVRQIQFILHIKYFQVCQKTSLLQIWKTIKYLHRAGGKFKKGNRFSLDKPATARPTVWLLFTMWFCGRSQPSILCRGGWQWWPTEECWIAAVSNNRRHCHWCGPSARTSTGWKIMAKLTTVIR